MSTPTKYEGHTPGPWHAKPYASPKDTFYVEDNNGVSLFGGRPLFEANANLIADAPALLAENARLREALRDVMQLATDGAYVYGAKQLEWLTQKPAFKRAEAALAPATPTQPGEPR